MQARAGLGEFAARAIRLAQAIAMAVSVIPGSRSAMIGRNGIASVEAESRHESTRSVETAAASKMTAATPAIAHLSAPRLRTRLDNSKAISAGMVSIAERHMDCSTGMYRPFIAGIEIAQ